MKKNSPSIDGFVPRRRGDTTGNLHESAPATPKKHVNPPVQELHNQGVQQPNHPQPRRSVRRSEIDDSLRSIDEPVRDKKGRVRKTPEERQKQKKRIKRIVILLVVILLAIGGFVAVRALIAGSKVFQGNVFDFAQKAPLKQDENGRSNILVYGTSEDNEGGEHPGADLTDSIMVVSIDQNKKNAFMISVPRDLWVKYDVACEVGYEGKINATYMCGSQNGKDEEAGANALREQVGEVFGLNMQYYAHVNNTVLRDAVNAVGGVEVKIESDDPRGIYDPNFDWQCNHQCNMVKYANGEVAQLDGDHALALARARNAQGGYGLGGGNFDRERNQQNIIRALQKKAISAGTLVNFSKVTGLIDALGDNLRTNFQIKEIRTLTDLAQEVNGDKLQSISLEQEGSAVVTTGIYGDQSIVRPVKGLYDYSGIAAYLQKKMTSNPVVREAAIVDVLNGSGVAGVAKTEADKLEKKGFTIGMLDNAPEGEYGKATIYQIGEGKPATKKKLEALYQTSVTKGDPPVLVSSETDFVVVIGQASSTQ
jgi:LCP family protein required for cell wall assembly